MSAVVVHYSSSISVICVSTRSELCFQSVLSKSQSVAASRLQPTSQGQRLFCHFTQTTNGGLLYL